MDKFTEEHINELEKICASSSDLDFIDANVIWFEYLESNYSFFSTMLKSKGASYFRSRFLEFVIEELKDEVNVNEGKNQGLSKEIIIQFLGVAIVGIVESYFTNELNEPSRVVAEQVGILLERNL